MVYYYQIIQDCQNRGLVMGIAEVTAKLETLSQEDYDMVVMMVNRLTENHP